MKSGKQRRAEIRARRIQRAIQQQVNCRDPRVTPPQGAVAADPPQLAHNNTWASLPRFYIDRAFSCRDCNQAQVWTAKQQKWWYEVAKGNIYSQAVRCRPCRRIEQARVAEVRRIAEEGIKRKALEKDS